MPVLPLLDGELLSDGRRASVVAIDIAVAEVAKVVLAFSDRLCRSWTCRGAGRQISARRQRRGCEGEGQQLFRAAHRHTPTSAPHPQNEIGMPGVARKVRGIRPSSDAVRHYQLRV